MKLKTMGKGQRIQEKEISWGGIIQPMAISLCVRFGCFQREWNVPVMMMMMLMITSKEPTIAKWESENVHGCVCMCVFMRLCRSCHSSESWIWNMLTHNKWKEANGDESKRQNYAVCKCIRLYKNAIRWIFWHIPGDDIRSANNFI